jgi:Pyruvate/2-oxoacid:ferredoxin oxidoreductase delta subunit
MEGNGPSGGNPIKMNVILISEDPVALDSVFCRIIDINPEFILTNVQGEIAGLGKYRDNEIQLVGDDINQFINKKFDIVRKPPINDVSMLGKIAMIKNYIIAKPVINYKKCRKCFRCVDACPVPKKALNLKKGLKNVPPVYDYSICIRCYCCQEMCPYKAIEVKTPLLGKLFFK